MNYKVLVGALVLSIVACSPNRPPNNAQVVASADRFQVGDNVVIDSRSNLMWSRCLLGAFWNGMSCAGLPTVYSWTQVQTLVRTIDYAGYNDWRIPTLDELKSLAEQDSVVPMLKTTYLNQAVFPMQNCQRTQFDVSNSSEQRCWHWTSTPIEASDHYLWIVYFGYGYGSGNDTTDAFALRLVRNNR
jgi:hypothetical protein